MDLVKMNLQESEKRQNFQQFTSYQTHQTILKNLQIIKVISWRVMSYCRILASGLNSILFWNKDWLTTFHQRSSCSWWQYPIINYLPDHKVTIQNEPTKRQPSIRYVVNPADRHRKRTISSDFSMAGQIVNTDMTTLAGYFLLRLVQFNQKYFKKLSR